ncbi:hypothetical protein MUK42_28641, partial [Musa troglodytarum]
FYCFLPASAPPALSFRPRLSPHLSRRPPVPALRNSPPARQLRPSRRAWSPITGLRALPRRGSPLLLMASRCRRLALRRLSGLPLRRLFLPRFRLSVRFLGACLPLPVAATASRPFTSPLASQQFGRPLISHPLTGSPTSQSPFAGSQPALVGPPTTPLPFNRPPTQQTFTRPPVSRPVGLINLPAVCRTAILAIIFRSTILAAILRAPL